jgi:hypothetical protein
MVLRPVTDEPLRWLENLYPAEAHWLWKWKFRMVDRGVAFDPAKFGWPWNPGTVSWVAPTALAMLAFQARSVTHSRVALGAAMLLDRACPSGGWNAGNSVVLGVPLDPRPDFTAMALLALRHSGHENHPIVTKAVDYLARRLFSVRPLYSLAWGIMALAAFDHSSVPKLKRQLAHHVSPNHEPRVLALGSLALETPTFTFQEYQR